MAKTSPRPPTRPTGSRRPQNADDTGSIQLSFEVKHTLNHHCNNEPIVDDSDDICILLNLASSTSNHNVCNFTDKNVSPLQSTNACIIDNSNNSSFSNNYVCQNFDCSISLDCSIKQTEIDLCVECIHLYYEDLSDQLANNDYRPNTGPGNREISPKSPIKVVNNVRPNNGSPTNKENSPTDNISYLGKRVINLSDHPLSKSDTSLLEKGITFAPTPGDADMAEIHIEVNKFLRRLLLKLHFHNPQALDGPPRNLTIPPGLVKFKKPSTWTPQINDPAVRTFVSNVNRSLSELNLKNRDRHNLTKNERESLAKLKTNKSIVIKKADKGSSIVVMNRSDYIKEAEKQLSDKNFYKEIAQDLTIKHQKEVNTDLQEYLETGELSPEVYDCLINTNPRTSALYLLPKIHKVKKAGEFPPGRPIISANGSPTERISAFVDENIKQAVPLIPFYIKDTTDFIRKVESIDAPMDCLLVTFDVTALYTNIPNNEGIRAVSLCLDQNQPPFCSAHVVLDLLRSVLTKNNFTFNGKQYLQVGGTAMGTKLAPSYANIFMGHLEQELLAGHHKKPSLWLRFIDDIFVVWPHSLDDLNAFLTYMNSYHDTIKFTMEFSKEKIVFLDTIVKKARFTNKLLVELYTKPTDTHNYLHFNSFHPGHTKRGGPYGQFLRVRRNCTLESDYNKHSLFLKSKYMERGYPEPLLENSRLKALRTNRTQLLNPLRNQTENKKKAENVLPLILTFHPSNSQVREIIMKNWGVLKFSDLCQEALPEIPLFATRKNRNLKDELIKSRLEPLRPKVTHNPKAHCKFFNCSVCVNLRKMKSFMSEETKKSYKAPDAQCFTPNLIYLLTCNICRKQYVGETKRPFVVRLKEHLADIRLKRDKPVAIHVNSHNAKTRTIIPQIIEIIKRDPVDPETTALRKKREIHWIYRLKTLLPHGLNSLG